MHYSNNIERIQQTTNDKEIEKSQLLIEMGSLSVKLQLMQDMHTQFTLSQDYDHIFQQSRELMQIEKFISEEKLKHRRLEEQIASLTEQNEVLVKDNRRLAHENKTLGSQIGKLSDKLPEMVKSTAKSMKKRKMLSALKIAKLQKVIEIWEKN